MIPGHVSSVFAFAVSSQPENTGISLIRLGEWLGLSQNFALEHTYKFTLVDTARGVVAFLLFLLPKPSVEAEQRQQMVPRATRSTVGFQLLDSQGTMARHQRSRGGHSSELSLLVCLLTRFLSRQCHSRAASRRLSRAPRSCGRYCV
jgi:hypothetical protein